MLLGVFCHECFSGRWNKSGNLCLMSWFWKIWVGRRPTVRKFSRVYAKQQANYLTWKFTYLFSCYAVGMLTEFMWSCCSLACPCYVVTNWLDWWPCTVAVMTRTHSSTFSLFWRLLEISGLGVPWMVLAIRAPHQATQRILVICRKLCVGV